MAKIKQKMLESEELVSFEEWLAFGIQSGYCTQQFCYTHDGIPLSDKESELWFEGEDPCLHLVRLGTEEEWDNNV